MGAGDLHRLQRQDQSGSFRHGQGTAVVPTTSTDICRVTVRSPRVAVTKKLYMPQVAAGVGGVVVGGVFQGVPMSTPVLFFVEPLSQEGKPAKFQAMVSDVSPPVAENAYR